MMNEKKLIYADDLLAAIRDDQDINGANFARAKRHIEAAPAVDAVEVVHGRWEMGIDEGDYEYGTCSVCGYNEYNAFGCCLPHNYCPNCGAKMDGDGNG